MKQKYTKNVLQAFVAKRAISCDIQSRKLRDLFVICFAIKRPTLIMIAGIEFNSLR